MTTSGDETKSAGEIATTTPLVSPYRFSIPPPQPPSSAAASVPSIPILSSASTILSSMTAENNPTTITVKPSSQPRKRPRPNDAATPGADGGPTPTVTKRKLSPFALLELLTSDYDVTPILREAAAAGFQVGLLERLDQAIEKRNGELSGQPSATTKYRVTSTSKKQLTETWLDRHEPEMTSLDTASFDFTSNLKTSKKPIKSRPRKSHLPQVPPFDSTNPPSSATASATDTLKGVTVASVPVSSTTHPIPATKPASSNVYMTLGQPVQTMMIPHKMTHDTTEMKKMDIETITTTRHSTTASAASTTHATPSHHAPTAPTSSALLGSHENWIRLRKADLPPHVRKLLQQHRARHTATLHTTPVRIQGGEDVIMTNASEHEPPSSTTAADSRHIAASEPPPPPPPPPPSYDNTIAGLSSRQARFLHTAVTSTNILPEARRSQATKPAILPYDGYDWKGSEWKTRIKTEAGDK